MLKDNLNCSTKRVGKHKISVFVVTRFDKKEDNYKEKPYERIQLLMTHIIFGPPGTGKTTKVNRKSRRVTYKKVLTHKIGYFTFSKNATQEATIECLKTLV